MNNDVKALNKSLEYMYIIFLLAKAIFNDIVTLLPRYDKQSSVYSTANLLQIYGCTQGGNLLVHHVDLAHVQR